MTPEEMRMEIARHQGSKTFPKHDWDERDDRRYFVCTRCGERVGWGNYSKSIGVTLHPCSGDELDYPNDLNAMHEAELHLSVSDALRYEMGLAEVTRAAGVPIWRATSGQRCEVYVRVINSVAREK